MLMALTHNKLHQHIHIVLLNSIGIVAHADTRLPCTIQHQYVWMPPMPHPRGSSGPPPTPHPRGSSEPLPMSTELYHGTKCIGVIELAPCNSGLIQITFTITNHTISLLSNELIRGTTKEFHYYNCALTGSTNLNKLSESTQLHLHSRHQASLMCMNAISNVEHNYTNDDRHSVMETLMSINHRINQMDDLETSQELMNTINHLEQHYNCMSLNNSCLDNTAKYTADIDNNAHCAMLSNLCSKKHTCCDILDAAYQCMSMYEDACESCYASPTSVLRSKLSDTVTKFNIRKLCDLDEGVLFQLARNSQSDSDAYKEELYNSLLLINNYI